MFLNINPFIFFGLLLNINPFINFIKITKITTTTIITTITIITIIAIITGLTAILKPVYTGLVNLKVTIYLPINVIECNSLSLE
jgi:hypothetical protein